MAPFFYVQVTGHHRLDRMLADMPINMERNVVRKGLRRGAKHLMKEMKKNVPKDEYQLVTTINTRAIKRSRSLSTRVLGKVGIKVWTDPTRLAQIHQRIPAFMNPHWTEYGVPNHVSGNLPAQPWARPAMVSVVHRVVFTFRIEVARFVAQLIASGNYTPTF